MGEKYDFHLFVGRPDSETTSACDITAKCANKHCVPTLYLSQNGVKKYAKWCTMSLYLTCPC